MTIHRYRYDDDSAPNPGNGAGELIALLDACLVNGYGTISGAGWTKEYSGTNKAVYRPPEGNRCYLRIDNTYSYYAVPQAYATMSDVDTGTEPFSNAATNARTWIFHHSSTDNYWDLIVSPRSLYWVTGYTVLGNRSCHFFGDYIPLNSSFQYNTALCHGCTTSNDSNNDAHRYMMHLNIVNGKYLRRGWDEVDISGKVFNWITYGDNTTWVAYNSLFKFPDIITGDLMLDQMKMKNDSSLIGIMPGIYESMNCNYGYSTSFYQTISGTGQLSGRNIEYIPIAGSRVFFDSTGPWY